MAPNSSAPFPADFSQSKRFHTHGSFIKTEWCYWGGFGQKGALPSTLVGSQDYDMSDRAFGYRSVGIREMSKYQQYFPQS